MFITYRENQISYNYYVLKPKVGLSLKIQFLSPNINFS